MRVIDKDELKLNVMEYVSLVEKGVVFIYGTDTIYGLGCNAIDEKAVNKLRDIKGRHNAPYSVIAPSKEWIRLNCEITSEAEKWLEKLPGPYTLILKLKRKNAVAESVTKGLDTIGVRIPDHWVSKFVGALGFPIITTSVNKTDQEFMTSIDDLDHDIRAAVHFVVDEGKIEGHPSTIVHLDKKDVKVIDRKDQTH